MEVTTLHRDKDLFTRIAHGDAFAFKELFELYYELLHWNAHKILKSDFWAEEVTQEVFLQVWSGREGLATIDDPSAWLYRLTANRCFDRIRRQNLEIRMQYVANQALHGSEITELNPAYDFTVLQQLVKDAIEQLPEQQRLVYRMQQEEDLTYQEIADRLNISRHTVRNHMAKAIQSVRAYLQTHGELFLLLYGVWLSFKKYL